MSLSNPRWAACEEPRSFVADRRGGSWARRGGGCGGLLGCRDVKTLAFVVVVGVLVGAGAGARAEDVAAYQADGDADAGAADARVAALDEAFGKAVSQALGDLLEPEVRRQSKAVLDRELVGHARLWVLKFTVTKEGIADDRKQLSVSVRIDRDKLRARLGELNIAIRPAGDAPAANAQTVTVLLRVTTPDVVHATYGSGADKDVPGLAALSSALRRGELAIKRAPSSGPAAKPDGELPLDDDAAGALATEAKTELAAIAGVTVGPPVALRGVAGDGALVTAHVRLVDRTTHKLIGQGAVVTAARGTDPSVVGYAIDHALVVATADILAQPGPSLAQAPTFSGSDVPVGEPGIVLVRLARTTPWSLVQSEIKHLVGARGVSRAMLRHVSPSGWVIGVATAESIDRIASIVKKSPASDTQVSVKVVGTVVEASVSGAP